MKNIEILTQTILPLSLHRKNPRTIMGQTEWEKIAKAKREEAGYHCMCCGEYVPHRKGNYLDCHEVYNIDMEKREFEIADFVSLCKKCHDYIHTGFLRVRLADGRITRDYYDMVIQRGNKMLAEAGLKKENLPDEEICNPNWVLRYNGKIY